MGLQGQCLSPFLTCDMINQTVVLRIFSINIEEKKWSQKRK